MANSINFNQHFPGIIQIINYIAGPVADYLKIGKANGPFPDFKAQCPLCGGKNCAVFLGYYYRTQVVIAWIIWYHFPIRRFRCRRKGPHQPTHRTFSLLPHWLVPYYQHGLGMILEAIRLHRQHGNHFTQTKDAFSERGQNTDLPLENQQIRNFIRLLVKAFHQLCAVPELKPQLHQTGCFYPHDPLASVLEFSAHYQSPRSYHPGIPKAEKLSPDFFYHWQDGDYFPRQFLFGTPSQKC